MNRLAIVRIVAVLIGAGALFVLQQSMGVAIYIAFPAALAIYLAVKVVLGLAVGAGNPAP